MKKQCTDKLKLRFGKPHKSGGVSFKVKLTTKNEERRQRDEVL